MTLSELRYLVAVADLRHFGHAAERCHITQSTLSTQLRKLEDFLGITLFERTSRAVTVTPIGESIVIRARRIIEEVDQISDLARRDEGGAADAAAHRRLRPQSEESQARRRTAALAPR